jgi:Ubiquitin family
MDATQEDPTSVPVGLGEKRPAVDEVGDHVDSGNDAKRSTPVHQSPEGGADLAAESREPESQALDPADSIAIKVQLGKNIVSVERSLDSSVLQLKQDIEKETGVPTANQKLLFKGTLKDEQTLRQVSP